MSVQKQRKTIDVPADQVVKRRGFGWSREVLYVFIAASVLGYFAYDYVRQYAVMKPRINHIITQADITPSTQPFLPDVSGFTTDKIAAKIRPPVAGKLLFDKISDYPEFSEFLEGDAPRKLRLVQRRINPKALVIKSGHYTWSMVVAEVAKIDPEGKLIANLGEGKYMLRVPLAVLGGASLAITDKDLAELKLSKQGNAFLVTSGDLFIIRTTVKGWDEVKQTNTPYISKQDYRPFITGWSGGHLYIAGSKIESLGYLKGKSYGVSYSACTACLKVNPYLPPSTGAVVENDFTDMFYGFYSYEAHDVAIVGNTYHDNIIYAIDPHDRSRRLIIANNETYGTHYKHGIIVSREVNDSWIFGNHSHHNKGSGIMIDRLSINNVIANNLSEYNEQDGLTFFESQDNTTWGNTFQHNGRNGILARNSWNIKMYNDKILLNKGVAVEVYALELRGKELHRDFELDPFTMKADATIVGAKIKGSGPSIFKMEKTDFIDVSGLQIWAGTDLFSSAYWYNRRQILDNIEKKGTVIRFDIGYKSTDTVKFPTKHE